MLRTNLSTRPFYNERILHLVLGLVAVVVLGITVFNVTRIVSLSRRNTDLISRAERDEAQAREIRARAASIRQKIDLKKLEEVSAAAREANTLIDRRTFSWTELFNVLETTMPADVRLVSVRPKIEKEGGNSLQLIVSARRVEDIDAFMEKLETTGAFGNLLSREEHTNEDGLLQATLEARYQPGNAVRRARSGAN
jgi:hypothetical protein